MPLTVGMSGNSVALSGPAHGREAFRPHNAGHKLRTGRARALCASVRVRGEKGAKQGA